jgi:hypothetical protein
MVKSVARSAEPPIAVDVEGIDEVLCITVPEQHSKPHSFGGKFFIREEATSREVRCSNDSSRGRRLWTRRIGDFRVNINTLGSNVTLGAKPQIRKTFYTHTHNFT